MRLLARSRSTASSSSASAAAGGENSPPRGRGRCPKPDTSAVAGAEFYAPATITGAGPPGQVFVRLLTAVNTCEVVSNTTGSNANIPTDNRRKLTDDDIAYIIERLAAGDTQRAIADSLVDKVRVDRSRIAQIASQYGGRILDIKVQRVPQSDEPLRWLAEADGYDLAEDMRRRPSLGNCVYFVKGESTCSIA